MNTQNLKKWFLDRKCTFGGIIILLILSAWAIFDKDNNREFKMIENDEQLGEFLKNASEDDINRYVSDYKKAEAKDNYGGDTPEETMKLFIAALKAGDTELAAKYFVLKNQKQEAENLAISKEKGYLDEYIKILDSEKTVSHNDLFDTYEFEAVYKGESLLLTKLVKNPQTNKWKMESL